MIEIYFYDFKDQLAATSECDNLEQAVRGAYKILDEDQDKAYSRCVICINGRIAAFIPYQTDYEFVEDKSVDHWTLHFYDENNIKFKAQDSNVFPKRNTSDEMTKAVYAVILYKRKRLYATLRVIDFISSENLILEKLPKEGKE